MGKPLADDRTLLLDVVMRHRLAAEERGARMALEAAAKTGSDAILQHCLSDGRCSAGDYAAVAFNAIRQIDPAALKESKP